MNVMMPPPLPGAGAPLIPQVSGSAEEVRTYEEAEEGLNPQLVWAMLRRNAIIVVAAVALALAAGLILTLLATPQYVATASIQIEQQTERILDTEDVQPPGSIQDSERFLQTQTDILRSRAMAISVAQSLKLFGSPRFYAAMGVEPALTGQGALTERANREQTLAILLDRLNVVLPKNSRVVEIAFESADPVLAADLANAYAKNFIGSNLQRKYDSSSYARDFLSNQLVDAKVKLEQSERQLNQYARSAGLIAPTNVRIGDRETTSSPQSVTISSLAQLNESFNSAKAARIAVEQKWRSASSVPVMAIPEVLANPAVQALVQQRAEKNVELQQEQTRHREEHPAVLEIQAQVTELDSQIRNLSNAIRDSIRGQYQVAQQQERSLSGQVGGLRQDTLSEQDRSVRFNILSREVDTNRTLYDGLLQRFKELSAAAGIATNNISIIDTADPPLAPSSPRLLVNLLTALVAGLGLAGVLVFLREQIDDAVRSPTDIERKLALPVLGTIPRVPAGEDIMESLGQPGAKITESYSALRTALMYSTSEGLPQTLLVTSSQPAEGKSTSSMAIATSMAKLGKRVVLVDADLRRPSVHLLLGMSNEVGLSDLLVHRRSVEETVVFVEHQGIWLVPSGPIPPNPSDILSSGRLADILGQLKGSFDLVVLDGPPVLGLADAPLLSAQVDGTLLVIESNRGFRGRTKGAIRRLRDAQAVILGAVLTKFDARKAGVGQEYGYEYYTYGYGTEPRKLA